MGQDYVSKNGTVQVRKDNPKLVSSHGPEFWPAPDLSGKAFFALGKIFRLLVTMLVA